MFPHLHWHVLPCAQVDNSEENLECRRNQICGLTRQLAIQCSQGSIATHQNRSLLWQLID